MADGEVKINTKLDTSGVDKGLKDLNKKLDDAGKSIDNAGKKSKTLNTNLGGMNKTALATAGAVAGVAVAVKKTVDALNDCEAAYKIQRNAEIALAQAAKNNPYLNNESVYNLRNFASELQSMSNIGDEVSLKVMSQLAATGRNEEQIMQIMKAAADMAAVTGEDIATAATKLNATLNGNAGMLGRQVTAINNLTKEELESGRAIEIVAQQYNGSAAAMADNTVQLANAWGDFKENIGRNWAEKTSPIKKFFTDTLNDINEALALTADKKAAAAAREAGTDTAAQAKLNLEEAQAVLDEMDKHPGMSLRKGNGLLAGSYMPDKNWQTKRDAQAKEVEELTARYNDLTKAENDEAEANKRAADEAAAAADKRSKAEQRDKDAQNFIDNNKAALAERIASMELEAKLTEKDVDAGEVYNAYLQSYIDLITKSNGLVTENNSAAKARLALLNEWAEKAGKAATEEKRLAAAEELQSMLGEMGHKTIFDEYEEKNKKLDDYAARVQKMADKELITEEQKNAALLKIDEEYAQNKADLWQDIADEINSTTQQMVNYAKEMGDLLLEGVQAQTDAELAALEEKYDKGEVSETEYYEKQKEIRRKAAQEEYKIKMFEWSASILAATANIAEGVSKAIAQGGTAGLITGALVGAAGAVQIASIIASKPVPPSFYTGGIIGGANGATMGGDNTYIHARAGEMVLNAAQQRSLWDKLNGQDTRGAAGYNLTVNNTQSGRVDTSIRQENNGFVIDIIDKHINKGFSDGTYDAGLAARNTRQEGVKIL